MNISSSYSNADDESTKTSLDRVINPCRYKGRTSMYTESIAKVHSERFLRILFREWTSVAATVSKWRRGRAKFGLVQRVYDDGKGVFLQAFLLFVLICLSIQLGMLFSLRSAPTPLCKQKAAFRDHRFGLVARCFVDAI